MDLKIIDNFLEADDYKTLCSLKLEKINSNEIKVYVNEIDDNSILRNEVFSEKFLKSLQNNYHQKALAILNELNPLKAKLYDYSTFSIIETGANYKFPIHDDTPNKLLSGVIYLYPENNTGTIFYSNKKGDNKRIIDWQQNRAVFFSRIEGKSWHAYKGDGKSNRIALVYNLMTKRLKDVYRLENNNYFFGLMRYKLNPYIYKFFKFNI